MRVSTGVLTPRRGWSRAAALCYASTPQHIHLLHLIVFPHPEGLVHPRLRLSEVVVQDEGVSGAGVFPLPCSPVAILTPDLKTKTQTFACFRAALGNVRKPEMSTSGLPGVPGVPDGVALVWTDSLGHVG